jgi:cysteinyl-tRNA synthetase
MLTALGMHLDDKTRPTKHDNRDTLADLLDVLVARREQARAAGDYASADRIRDDLARAGIVLEDTPSTRTWRTMTTPP